MCAGFQRERCQVWGFSLRRLFFPFFFFFFSASRKGCAAARCLCWMQETDALQEIWKQTGSPLSSGLLFTYTSLPPSLPPPTRFKSACILIRNKSRITCPQHLPPTSPNKETTHSVLFVLEKKHSLTADNFACLLSNLRHVLQPIFHHWP